MCLRADMDKAAKGGIGKAIGQGLARLKPVGQWTAKNRGAVSSAVNAARKVTGPGGRAAARTVSRGAKPTYKPPSFVPKATTSVTGGGRAAARTMARTGKPPAPVAPAVGAGARSSQMAANAASRQAAGRAAARASTARHGLQTPRNQGLFQRAMESGRHLAGAPSRLSHAAGRAVGRNPWVVRGLRNPAAGGMLGYGTGWAIDTGSSMMGYGDPGTRNYLGLMGLAARTPWGRNLGKLPGLSRWAPQQR